MQAVIPQREILNQMQIQTLLGAVQTLTMSLVQFSRGEDDDSAKVSRTDGGARMAAEHTLCNIYDRIDQIMADNARWETYSLKSVEEKLGALYDSNRALLDHRKEVESAPHMKYKPILMRMGEGWLAICGDPNFLDKAMCGYGETPKLALLCFDMIFEGTAPEELVRWLTTQNQHEKSDNQVDGQGTSGTSSDEGGGQISGANSPEAE